ncbi:hypothetical protein F4778DRAFT_371079 [Xylariomycetidae sp. FL2044]|nr:hypothetical protein F4778DRAFT_371079 [Xylariomycetidae sp. FL2044]
MSCSSRKPAFTGFGKKDERQARVWAERELRKQALAQVAREQQREEGRDNGLLFREWLQNRLRPDHKDWYREHKFIATITKNAPGQKGPRSLCDMAVKAVADNLSSLELEHADKIPLHLMQSIFYYTEKHHETISLHSWKFFLKVILQQAPKGEDWSYLPPNGGKEIPLWPPPKLYKHRIEVEFPNLPLDDYIKPLNSTSFEFLSHLKITGSVSFGTHELLGLPQLKNLAVLEIIQPRPRLLNSNGDPGTSFPRVNDSILREWSTQPGVFPVLRVLRIWGEHFTTARSLQYISKFPALGVYDVAGNAVDWADPVPGFGWGYIRSAWSQGMLMALKSITQFRPHDMPVGWGSDKIRDHLALGMLARRMNVERLMSTLETGERMTLDRLIHSLKGTIRRLAVERQLKSKLGPDLHRAFETWGFTLYSALGKVRENRDLMKHGITVPEQEYYLSQLHAPPRPYVSLSLGHSCHEQIGLERFESREGNVNRLKGRRPKNSERGEKGQEKPSEGMLEIELSDDDSDFGESLDTQPVSIHSGYRSFVCHQTDRGFEAQYTFVRVDETAESGSGPAADMEPTPASDVHRGKPTGREPPSKRRKTFSPEELLGSFI